LLDDSAASRMVGRITKLDCFIRFDEVNFWLARTRDLIANAEAYSCAAFVESFRQLRREARKSEFALVIALFHFKKVMEKQTIDLDESQREDL
jgi:hypothetical protein